MSEKDKKQIELLMKCLDITEQEAIQVLKDDKQSTKAKNYLNKHQNKKQIVKNIQK